MAAMIHLFESIRSEFPALRMQLDRAPANVDLSLEIPRQPGLDFDVSLNQQGDELHLLAGCFWLEWFPSGDDKIADAYRNAVIGVLTGQYRIVEHYRGERCVKAELQRLSGAEWQTIGTRQHLLGMLYWGKRATRLLQNSRALQLD